jgi:hypothetical protein
MIDQTNQQNFASFENSTDERISLHIVWSAGGHKNTIVFPGEVAEIVCDVDSGRFCHRSDGGTYNSCPANSPSVVAGDYWKLLLNGASEKV